MKNHEFSVCITTYNSESYITRTLDNVAAQTYKNFEIVLVDDGSKVDPTSIIEAYKADHPELQLNFIRQENEGPSGSRRKAYMNATKEYLCFLDADDAWAPNKLERMNDAINEHPGYTFYYHDEQEVWDDFPDRHDVIRYRDMPEDALTDLILNGNNLSMSASCVLREFVVSVDPFHDKKRTGEDYECWIRLAKAGCTFYHVAEVLGDYHRMPDSLTRKNTDYLRKTNDNIVDFYDYLDPEKFTREEIDAMKAKRRAYNEYLVGRYYHDECDYREARRCYTKSFRMGNHAMKCVAATVLAVLHIRIAY
jgi:glycosyltransferase involved in cell wall biosynthesis